MAGVVVVVDDAARGKAVQLEGRPVGEGRDCVADRLLRAGGEVRETERDGIGRHAGPVGSPPEHCSGRVNEPGKIHWP